MPLVGNMKQCLNRQQEIELIPLIERKTICFYENYKDPKLAIDVKGFKMFQKLLE
jgi:hypothetical protein